jgi:MFS family permease
MTSIAAPATSTPARGPRMRDLAVPMSGVLIAQFVANLSATIVATALPSIYLGLEGPREHATWIVAATILGNAASTPIWGKLVDRFPPKRVLQWAVVLFAIGCIVSGFAVDTTMLITGRAIQGVALGGVVNANSVVVAGLVAARYRGKLNAWSSAVQTSATLAGPVLGGLLVEAPALGWRWAFFLSVPFAIVSVLLLAFTLPKTPAGGGRSRSDIAGGLLIGVSVSSALIAVSLIPEFGRFPALTIATGVIGVVGACVLVWVELRAENPVIPLRFLKDRTIRASTAAAFLVGTAMFSATVFTAQFLQIGVGTSPSQSGLLLIPGALATVGVNIIAGQYMGRTARIKPVLIFGTTALTVGNIMLALVFLAPIPFAVAGAILISCGTGATLHNLVVSAQNVTSRAHIGSVSALVVFGFMLGGTVGLVSLGTLLTELVQSHGSTGLGAYGPSMAIVFGIGAAVMFPAVLITALMPNELLRSTMSEDSATPITGPIETATCAHPSEPRERT